MLFLRPFSGKPGFDVLFVPELPQPQQVVLLCVPQQNHLMLKSRGNLPWPTPPLSLITWNRRWSDWPQPERPILNRPAWWRTPWRPSPAQRSRKRSWSRTTAAIPAHGAPLSVPGCHADRWAEKRSYRTRGPPGAGAGMWQPDRSAGLWTWPAESRLQQHRAGIPPVRIMLYCLNMRRKSSTARWTTPSGHWSGRWCWKRMWWQTRS